MNKVFSSFGETFSIFRKDRPTLLLSMFPPIIGIILYIFLGSIVYSKTIGWGKSLIEEQVSSGSLGAILYYLLIAVFYLVLYFLVSWTFVLIVSVISSPFNDALSNRVEKLIQGQVPEDLNQTFKRLFKNALVTIINEIKKVSAILVLSILAFLLSFTYIGAPISVLISGLLLAVTFIDYSWSRHRYNFSQCSGDIKNNIFSYTLTGSAFTFLMWIPIINIFLIPFSVIFFTILWTKRNV